VDDIVIKIEHPLGINPRPQMLASILSKKLAINANYLLVDIPTGAGTKIPTIEVARAYARDFTDLGEKLGIHIECAITYADQPVGSAIGPNLEARECIRILEGSEHPASVVEKACECAGILLEMAGFHDGVRKAREILSSGQAHKKFLEIVVAQGGRADLKSSDLKPGKYSADILAPKSGYVNSIRNKDLVAVAKACGSANDKGAGLLLFKKKGQRVEEGDVLFTLFAALAAAVAVLVLDLNTYNRTAVLYKKAFGLFIGLFIKFSHMGKILRCVSPYLVAGFLTVFKKPVREAAVSGFSVSPGADSQNAV
jgi:AMP phosphorylase